MSNYDIAKQEFSAIGVDTEKALTALQSTPISVHCWQGDDVGGCENAGDLTGGIQVTGNYMGKARTPKELMADFTFALSKVGGTKRINLHANYAISDVPVARDALTIAQFMPWVDFAKEHGFGIDFNPTFFSHPMVKDGLTLSSPDNDVRAYWIRHAKCCRKISAQIGEMLGSAVLCNIWIPDGYKDIPADRMAPRKRLKDSLDAIYADKYDKKFIVDSVESKVFGIGLESYTVGSHEFYMGYAIKNDIMCLLDNGHFHPTENVADKISSLLLYSDNVALHVTRSVRWDSDHVVLLTDEIKEIAYEIVACGGAEKTLIGLDYFDASINRIVAWVTGAQNFQKALLIALLQPIDSYKAMQEEHNFSELMMKREQHKMMPYGAVWAEFLARNNCEQNAYDSIKEYETSTLSARN
ncbi:MAG: L-rhamnose isomerase [Bacillota bacterium]